MLIISLSTIETRRRFALIGTVIEMLKPANVLIGSQDLEKDSLINSNGCRQSLFDTAFVLNSIANEISTVIVNLKKVRGIIL